MVSPKFSRVFGNDFGLRISKCLGRFAKWGLMGFPMVFGQVLGLGRGCRLRSSLDLL